MGGSGISSPIWGPVSLWAGGKVTLTDLVRGNGRVVGKTDDLQRPAGSSSETFPEEPWASSVPCGLCD